MAALAAVHLVAAALGGSRGLCIAAGAIAGLAHTAAGFLAGAEPSPLTFLFGFLIAQSPEAQQNPIPLAIAAAIGGVVAGFVYSVVADPADSGA